MSRDLGCRHCGGDVDIFRTHWQAELADHRRTFYFCSETCAVGYAKDNQLNWAWVRRDGRT